MVSDLTSVNRSKQEIPILFICDNHDIVVMKTQVDTYVVVHHKNKEELGFVFSRDIINTKYWRPFSGTIQLRQ